MTRKEIRFARLAVEIAAQLEHKQPLAAHLELPSAAWDRCQEELRKIKRAERHGWHLAAASLRIELKYSLELLRGELLDIQHQLKPPANEDGNHAATASDILADMVALHEEFEVVSFGKRDHIIAVTTEPIELEGIYVGPFKIELDWSDLLEGHPQNYRVIAMEPHPAESNDSVTHPHVSDETVCEGEAYQPILSALKQGRLLDFFQIVDSLLHTYNDGSPFVALDQWYGGASCADCGTRGSEEDDWWCCEKCDVTLCEGCYFECTESGETRCSHCVRQCHVCLEHVCEEIVRHCKSCNKRTCRNCFENERCMSCHEQE